MDILKDLREQKEVSTILKSSPVSIILNILEHCRLKRNIHSLL